MELRHLRYFIAVAEEGSVTVAAQKRLHTAQPSLSRQIHDLELELGVQLLIRGARGIELTAAGRVFLDHARVALLQVEAAGEAARRAAQPARTSFAIGFLTGYEMDWLPAVMSILRAELPSTEVTIHSQDSPDLAGGLIRGKIGARPEIQVVAQGSADRPDAARSRSGGTRLRSTAGSGRPYLYRHIAGFRADAADRGRRLYPSARSCTQAGSRRREYFGSHFTDSVDARRQPASAVCAKPDAENRRQPPDPGHAAHDRPRPRLQ
jgi:Bacterial regulatory helix-turn-helix protein, lysR family